MRTVTWGLALLMSAGLWACDDGDGGEAQVADANTGAGGGGGVGGEVVELDMAPPPADMGAAGMGGGVEAVLQGLSIEPPAETFAGTATQFAVVGSYDDGSTRDLSAEAVWSSTNPDLALFGDGGLAELPHGGDVTITATVGDLVAEHRLTVECDYPRFPANILMGRPVAPVQWDQAFREGNREGAFDFRTASCGLTYKDVDAFLLIVSAEWCPPCIEEITRLGPQSVGLLEKGGLLTHIVLQNTNYGPINSVNANRFINRLAGVDSPGLRLGVIGSNPERFFNNEGLIEAFPTTFVVRKRDMQVVADSRTSNWRLDAFFNEMLADLEADWSDPLLGVLDYRGSLFENQCEDGEEEASEPNDSAAQATVISAGEHAGGICAHGMDFYQFDIQGNWRFRIEFNQSIGELALARWDPVTDYLGAPPGQSLLERNPRARNSEEMVGRGPAMVAVSGWLGTSAPYTIILTEE